MRHNKAEIAANTISLAAGYAADDDNIYCSTNFIII